MVRAAIPTSGGKGWVVTGPVVAVVAADAVVLVVETGTKVVTGAGTDGADVAAAVMIEASSPVHATDVSPTAINATTTPAKLMLSGWHRSPRADGRVGSATSACIDWNGYGSALARRSRIVLLRIRGLFIIVRALLPFLLIVGAAAITWVAAQSVQDATRQYGDDMSAQLAGIEAAIDEANDGLEAVGAYVTASGAAADELLERVEALRDSVEIELPDFLPGDGILSIPIPGVEALQLLAGELVAAGQRAAEPVLKVGALADVPPQLEQAAEDSARYAGEIRSALSGWLIALFILLVVGGLIWMVAALRPITSEIGRGWSMLMGRPAPERAVLELEKRVRTLERKLGGP